MEFATSDITAKSTGETPDYTAASGILTLSPVKLANSFGFHCLMIRLWKILNSSVWH